MLKYKTAILNLNISQYLLYFWCKQHYFHNEK